MRRSLGGVRSCVVLVAGLLVAGLLAAVPATASPGRSSVPGVPRRAVLARQASSPATGIGTTYNNAASSCWQIKQTNAAAPSKAYWIQTAQLVDPVSIYCDMVTGGGGWELIGRGRNGWDWDPNGQGSAAAVTSTPSGTGAFAPATLSNTTVDGLLGGGRVDALSGGVQLRRSVDSAGAGTATTTLNLASRATWTWAFGGGIRLTSAVFPGGTAQGGYTTNVSVDANDDALNTLLVTAHNFSYGFGLGPNVSGTNSATSYLYSYNGEGNALPFTQVWIRPQLGKVTYPSIPAAGAAAQPVAPLLSTTVQPAPWGVTGLGKAYTGEGTMQVETFQQIGSVMYVGGLFTTVRNASGSTSVAQPYLAAFDLSGNWISSFRPTLDGEVWALKELNGKLLVGGDFSTVDGASSPGLTLLDPTSGAVVPSWNVTVGGTESRVRALGVTGTYVYIGGSYTQLGPAASRIGVNNVGRVTIATGAVDASWRPNINGAVIDLNASAQGDRVYVVGAFSTVNGAAQSAQTTLSTSTGQQVSGLQPWVESSSNDYQQAILEEGSTVWQGGSEHVMSVYNRSDYSRRTSWITKAPPGATFIGGGDTQRLVEINGVTYATCHCSAYVYDNTYSYTSPMTTGTDVNPVDWMYAVRNSTETTDPNFWIANLKSANGNGVWATTADSNSCLWFGGDFTAVGSQWLGSFGRVCSRDTTVPSTPTALKGVVGSSGAQLSWQGSTDNSGVAPRYEVWRNNQVVALTSSLSYTDSGAHGTYHVDAIDATGNRSAVTAGVSG